MTKIFNLLIISSLISCTQIPYKQNVESSYILSGYADEIVSEINSKEHSSCDISIDNIKTSLISKSNDFQMRANEVISGQIHELWTVRNCDVYSKYEIIITGEVNGIVATTINKI